MGEFFTNIVKQVEPDSTLFEPEIDLILVLIRKVAQSFQHELELGTFILDGQTYGGDPQLITRGNFAKGIYRRQFYRTYNRTSDQIAEESIDQLLVWPGMLSRYRRHFAERFFEQNGMIYPRTGIYQDGELLVLAMNATHGRFLASIQAQAVNDPYYDFGDEISEALLYAVSEALCMMMREDVILQRSATQLMIERENPLAANIVLAVVNEFAQGELPEMRAWQDWHEPANKSGQLTLPFL